MGYDLTQLKAPRSAGGLLRFLVWLAEGPFGGLLAKKFFADIGIDAMRLEGAAEALPLEHRLLRVARQTHVEGGEPACAPEPPPASERPYETAADFVAAYRDGALTPEDVAERDVWSPGSTARESVDRLGQFGQWLADTGLTVGIIGGPILVVAAIIFWPVRALVRWLRGRRQQAEPMPEAQ